MTTIDHSESFPYFRVHRHHNVPYAAVLRVVDLIEGTLQCFVPPTMPALEPGVILVIQEANKREHKRRYDVMRESIA